MERLTRVATRTHDASHDAADPEPTPAPTRLARRVGPGIAAPVHAAPPTVDGVTASRSFADAINAGIHPARDPIIARALASGGRALDGDLRAHMERAVAADLSDVRIHDDDHAAAAAANENAHAFALGSHIVFGRGRFAPDTRDGRWLLAHELAHTVQQRGATAMIQRFDPHRSGGDAHEDAADAVADAAVAEGAAPAPRRAPRTARGDVRFGPAAVTLLRTTVGLPRRGTLDAAFMTAARARIAATTAAPTTAPTSTATATSPTAPATTGAATAPTAPSPARATATAPGAPSEAAPEATDTTLDWETVRALPFFARPSDSNPVRTWYGAREGIWTTMDPARRTTAIAAVVAALEVDAADMTWSATDRRPHLVVTPRFVQRAVAWQVWQRTGIELDGKLGDQALVALGVAVDDRAGARVSFDAIDDARTTRGTSFGERLEAVVGAGRTTSLTGELAPEVGIGAAMHGLSPAAFVAAMHAAHAALVASTFFPGTTAAHSLDEALATLELTPNATRRLSELTTTPGYGALLALIATPESAALQHARFTERVDPMLAILGPLGSHASCGTVMLSVLVGSATGVDLSTDAAAQRGFIEAYLADDAARLAPYFEALLRRETVARPDPFPARAVTLERAINQFLAFWSTPFPGSDVDPMTVSTGTTGTTGGTTTATGATALPLATGRAAVPGAAMIAHSTADAALATAYNALGDRVPAGFERDWASYAASFQTIRFLNGTVTGHHIFLERLARAEAWLTARHADITSRVTATHSSQLREFESAAKLSYHHLGLAVDISAGANPWVGSGRSGSHATRAAVFALVSWYATWLTGHGEAMSSVGASEIGFGNTDTGAVWDRFAAASDSTREYFALAGNPAALAARIAALAARPPGAPGGFAHVPELPANLSLAGTTAWEELATRSRTADAAHWTAMITAQQRAWEREIRTEGGGFMSLQRDLVIALRDIGGLAWGACDFAAHSESAGDFMHFDARTIFSYAAYLQFRRALPA